MSQPPTPAEVRRVRAALLSFFDRERRDLPWRRTGDPYAVWVSEVMLQQTRVETVVPYYRRWLETFPDAVTLADAPEDEVLRLWEGLGYYSRARNLHRAAQVVRDVHGGSLPSTPEGLRALPGVGPYTAGAVASIAFGHAEPAIDGNVTRVFARWFDDPSPTPARLATWGRALVDPERPGDFNQALMELGSLVCTPRSPRCGECPIAGGCRARVAGTVAERPARKERRAVPHAVHAVLVAARRDEAGRWQLCLERRPDRGLLAGMWAFSEQALEGEAGADPDALHEAIERIAGRLGLDPAPRSGRHELAPVPHVFSHLRVTYLPVVASVGRGNASTVTEVRWVTADDRGTVALPVAQQRIFAQACVALGAGGGPSR